MFYLPLHFQGGEEQLFVVDTGASCTIIDQAMESRLGKSTGTVDAADEVLGRKIPLAQYPAPRLALGDVKLLTGDWVLVQDFTRLREVCGRPIMGILGMDCLRHYCLQLDFENRRVRFLDPSRLRGGELGTPFSLTVDSGCPAVAGDLLGAAGGTTRIDTGNNASGSLGTALFEEALAADKIVVEQENVASLSANQKRRTGRVKECVFGGKSYPGLILGEGQGGSTIGFGFLARFLVTFDFPEHVMYLKPRPRTFPPDEKGMGGLSVLKKNGRPVVYSVDEDGPAAEAGIRPGDVILRLNDAEAAGLELWDLRRRFQSGDGDAVRVVLERDGQPRDVTVSLRRKI